VEDERFRGTGRTTVRGLRALADAIENPGKEIQVWNECDTFNLHVSAAELAVSIGMGMLDCISLNTRNHSITVEPRRIK
jgi:hypothetical protein